MCYIADERLALNYCIHPVNDVSTSEVFLSKWQVQVNLPQDICKYLKPFSYFIFDRGVGSTVSSLVMCSDHKITLQCMQLHLPAKQCTN